MRALIVMFDSLNRHYLPAYGGNKVPTPNFDRLAERTVTYDNSYVCSMPCMPARRDLHTARPSFLHRCWGPMEPCDTSIFQQLHQAGVHSHLITDHYHYFECGGSNYHTAYSTWEFVRGQEGDNWIPDLTFDPPESTNFERGAEKMIRQDFVNRETMKELGHCQTRVFESSLSFLDRHANSDNWVLQVECFDPHEPFYSDEEFRSQYPELAGVPISDWPRYGYLKDTGQAHLLDKYVAAYSALLQQCDANLGRILDKMDEHDLWDDTLLMVGTDHGFMFGEHDFVAKNLSPLYQEVANTPFFMWDPRTREAGTRSDALVQILDWGPTLLDLFGVEQLDHQLDRAVPAETRGDLPKREDIIFGYHGHYANITDGKEVYMRGADNEANLPLASYTLMPQNMSKPYRIDELLLREEGRAFADTQGVKLPKYPRPSNNRAITHQMTELGHMLWDVQADPQQQSPIDDDARKAKWNARLRTWMQRVDAPEEEYERLGL